METREIYKEKYQAQIHEWTAKLDVLKARAEKMSAQTKLDAKPRMDSMTEKLDAAKAKMHDIASATDEKWEEVKKTVDHAWTETKAHVEGAYDAVMAMDGHTAAASAATPAAATAAKPAKDDAKSAKAPPS